MSPSERIQDVLALLRHHRLSPFDLVNEILDKSHPQYTCYRKEFFKEGNEKLFRFLDAVHSITSGKAKLKTWMQQPAALDLFCDVITEEMNAVQLVEQQPKIATVTTPEFIRDWTVSSHQIIAPCIQRILLAAAQTSVAKGKNKKKVPDTVRFPRLDSWKVIFLNHSRKLCNVLVKQLSYQRSTHSLSFPSIFGLFLWATGNARQTIDVLHSCGLSIGYTSVLSGISSLSSRCIDLAIDVGAGIHVFCYDNVNLSTSIFVEQRGPSSPAKVTSGTFAVLNKVRNGNSNDMKLAPIMERFKKGKTLKFNHDLCPTKIQRASFLFQLKIVTIRVLTKYVEGFASSPELRSLKSKPRRPIPKGYITEQFPLRATTIEEATVRGNLQFHDDIYTTQLKRNMDGLSEYAIPSINDQLTNSRIRSAQVLRARDVNPWERREVFQLGFGLFHLCLNLVWALLHVHRGSLADTGSLTYFFALLEKTRLGNEHPDYHTLLAALTQIFDGLILNAWRTQCGYPSLSEFAASNPSASIILAMAETIIQEYATPLKEKPGKDKSEGQEEESADEELSLPRPSTRKRRKPLVPPCITVASGPDPDNDKVNRNIRLLTRDLLYLSELIRAISDGDIGRIEDFLPQLAMMFRGAGSNNYCTEILHFILNLKHVWTPEFAYVTIYKHFINSEPQVSQRHNAGQYVSQSFRVGGSFNGHRPQYGASYWTVKGNFISQSWCTHNYSISIQDLLTAKGLESTWDRLGDISAAIDYLNKIKKKVSMTLRPAYQGSNHKPPDTSDLVWRVADKVRDNKLQVFTEKRDGNAKKLEIDVHLACDICLAPCVFLSVEAEL